MVFPRRRCKLAHQPQRGARDPELARWHPPRSLPRPHSLDRPLFSPRGAKYIAGCINEEISKAKCRVKEKDIRASPDANPERTRHLKDFNNMHEDIQRVNFCMELEACQSAGPHWHNSIGRIRPATPPMNVGQCTCDEPRHPHPFRPGRQRPRARPAQGRRPHRLSLPSLREPRRPYRITRSSSAP